MCALPQVLEVVVVGRGSPTLDLGDDTAPRSDLEEEVRPGLRHQSVLRRQHDLGSKSEPSHQESPNGVLDDRRERTNCADSATVRRLAAHPIRSYRLTQSRATRVPSKFRVRDGSRPAAARGPCTTCAASGRIAGLPRHGGVATRGSDVAEDSTHTGLTRMSDYEAKA